LIFLAVLLGNLFIANHFLLISIPYSLSIGVPNNGIVILARVVPHALILRLQRISNNIGFVNRLSINIENSYCLYRSVVTS